MASSATVPTLAYWFNTERRRHQKYRRGRSRPTGPLVGIDLELTGFEWGTFLAEGEG